MTSVHMNAGIRGNFLKLRELKKVAAHYGLNVDITITGKYRIYSDSVDFDVAKFAPSYIKHDDGLFTLRQAKKFLRYLQQPTRGAFMQVTPGELPPVIENDVIKTAANIVGRGAYGTARVLGFKESPQHVQVHEKRQTANVLWHFAAMGRVEKDDANIKTSGETELECCAATEEEIRKEDQWREEIEIGNPNDVLSKIPGSGFDPKTGFTFTLDDKVANPDLFKGHYQKELATTFWNLVDRATNDNRYRQPASDGHLQRPSRISLSGAEFERFCTLSEETGYVALLEAVDREEQIQRRLRGVQQRIAKIATDQVVQRLLDQPETNKANELKGVMKYTTALTPVLDSDLMREFWTRAHFMERKKPPTKTVARDLSVFWAVMEVYSRNGQVTPTQLEAIADEFYPLLAMLGKTAEIMQNALEKQREQLAAKGQPSNGALEDMNEKLAGMRQTFQSASAAGIVLDTDKLEKDYKDTLETLEEILGQGENILLKGAKEGPAAFFDVVKDIYKWPAESPRNFAITMAIFALGMTVLNTGSHADFVELPNQVTYMDEGGIHTVPVDPALYPVEALQRNVSGTHYILNPFSTLRGLISGTVVPPLEAYKKGMNMLLVDGTLGITGGLQDAIQGTANLLGLETAADTVFAKSSKMSTLIVAKILFWGNLLQNFTHAAFWGWIIDKGYQYRLKGNAKIFDLLHPLVDLGYQAGVSGLEAAHFKKRTTLSERLIRISESISTGKPKPYQGEFTIEDDAVLARFAKALPFNDLGPEGEKLLNDLSEAGMIRADLAALLPEEIQEATLEMRLNPVKAKLGFHETKRQKELFCSLKAEFRISAENLKPLMKALDQMDMVMGHVASGIGASDPWYVTQMQTHLTRVTRALRDYQAQDISLDKLNDVLQVHLQALMGAQFRYGENSLIYEATFGKEADKKAVRALRSVANSEFGRLKRADAIEQRREKIRGYGDKPLGALGHLRERAIIRGIAMWDGIARTAKGMGQIAAKPMTKRNLIGLGAVCAISTVADMLGYNSTVTDFFSAVSATGLSTGLVGGFFTIFNVLIDDVIGVHVGTGELALLTGTIAAIATKDITIPAVMSAFEKVRQGGHVAAIGVDAIGLKPARESAVSALSAAWSGTTGAIKYPFVKGGQLASSLNRSLGQNLTAKAQQTSTQTYDLS